MSVQHVYERCFDEDGGKTISATTCIECSGTLRTEGGETTCLECGLIVSEYRIDHTATLSDFPGDETNNEQTGRPLSPSRHDHGLSAEIGYLRDGYGNKLSQKTQRKFARLRRYHVRARCRSKAERNLVDAFTEIARIVSALELPFSVRERACTYFRKAQRENLLHGRSIESIAAGSVYAVCRCGGCTRTIDELATVARCDKQQVQNGYQILNLVLGLQATPPNPVEFVPQLASECSVSSDIQHRALELAKQAVQANLTSGCQPAGIAAACLYYAAKERGVLLTQAELASAANVSTVTIRTRYRNLRSELD